MHPAVVLMRSRASFALRLGTGQEIVPTRELKVVVVVVEEEEVEVVEVVEGLLAVHASNVVNQATGRQIAPTQEVVVEAAAMVEGEEGVVEGEGEGLRVERASSAARRAIGHPAAPMEGAEGGMESQGEGEGAEGLGTTALVVEAREVGRTGKSERCRLQIRLRHRNLVEDQQRTCS